MALVFLLASLAAYRLTVLLREDTITEWPRERFYDRFPPDERRALRKARWVRDARRCKFDGRQGDAPAVSFWGQLVCCPWCFGFWVSVLVWIVLWALMPLPLPLLWPWAMSSVVGLLSRST